MFAVPGWSVSSDLLKTQVDTANGTSKTGHARGKKEKSSRKRKRGTGQETDVQITVNNLADLWEKHVEGKTAKRSKPDRAKGFGQEKRPKENKGLPEPEGEPTTQDKSISGEKHGIPLEDHVKSPAARDDQAIQDNNTAEAGTRTVTAQEIKEAGKARYEARKKRKSEKALLRASGKAPPSRPAPPTETVLASKAESESGKRSRSSKSSPKDTSITERKELPPNNAPYDASARSSNTQRAPPEDKDKNRPTPTSHAPESAPESRHKPRPPSEAIPPSKNSIVDAQAPSLPSTIQIPPDAPSNLPSSSNLTPLQAKMKSKLISARFRHLNQTLYTTPSSQASALFTSQPSAYASYHAGFRAQVAVWPQNPIETFITDVKARGCAKREGLGAQKKAWRQQKKGKGKTTDSKASVNVNVEPLPRTHGLCTIADLGCGDATLATALLPSAGAKDLNLKLHSFDLSKGDGPNASLVTVADITALPLKESQVDVAIICLSLMGTNWVSCVDEVARVVRWGGEAWVAEIKSRFARVGQQRDGGIGKNEGSGGKAAGKKKRKQKGAESEDEDEGVKDVIEVDSDPDILTLGKADKGKKRTEEEETDVSAFVEVWRRRGFEIKGEPDLSNKMFVRMRFVKRGGNSKDKDELSGRNKMSGKMGAKTRFIDAEHGEDAKVDEAKVLKPCVYKLR